MSYTAKKNQMKKITTKKILATSAVITALLFVVLAIHLYLVTRPKPLDPNSVAMARVDIKQDLTPEQADKISSWVTEQNGVDHVLLNRSTKILVFTFFPAKNTADAIIKNTIDQFGIKAKRFMPSEAEMKGGCPVATNSLTYKAASFIKHIF